MIVSKRAWAWAGLTACLAVTGSARADGTPTTVESPPGDTSTVGVTLMIVGAGAAAVGGTLLVIDAARSEPEAIEVGLDPGLDGARGRAGQLPLEASSAVAPIGAALLGCGALIHLVGIAIVFGEGDEPSSGSAAVTVAPVVAPGYGGLRGAF